MDRREPTGCYDGGNALIDSLPEADRVLLVRELTVFATEVPACIVRYGDGYDEVLFPVDAIFSTTAKLGRGDVYEVALTGRQGVIGAEVALGVTTAPRSVLTQIAGRTARIPRNRFTRCVEESRSLLQAVQHYFLRRLYVAEQFVACNFAHEPTQRCARWILMLRDEAGRNGFTLRAEFLGMMLGLPPKAAAATGQRLHAMGVIRYADEELEILDPQTLSELSCECYALLQDFAPA